MWFKRQFCSGGGTTFEHGGSLLHDLGVRKGCGFSEYTSATPDIQNVLASVASEGPLEVGCADLVQQVQLPERP